MTHAARFTAMLLLLLAIHSFGGEASGWRGDGTGRYPSATPPTVWAKDKNVIWKTPLPSWSNATPVLVKDRIFICAEPNLLICLNVADGKLAWQKTHDYTELLTPEQLAQAKVDEQKAVELEKQRAPLRTEADRMGAELKKTPNDAALKQRLADKRKEVDKLTQELKAFTTWRPPATHSTNGYSSCTPVSDGQHVYVLFGSGLAACYDLDGQRSWLKFIEKPTHEWGHSASPVLCGDKLLLQVLGMTCLSASSGEVLWKAKANPRWGTPVHATLGGVDVVITANGDIIRLADGKVLAINVSKVEFCAPVVNAGVVYFIENGGKALLLPAQAAEVIKPQVLWQAKLANDRYYASPIVHDGLIYCIQQKYVFSVLDAGTAPEKPEASSSGVPGAVIYEKPLALGGGIPYPSLTLAGKYLFVSSDNGTTLVLEPGREYKEVAKNLLEPFRASPVFSGKRMYIRALKALYCIGE